MSPSRSVRTCDDPDPARCFAVGEEQARVGTGSSWLLYGAKANRRRRLQKSRRRSGRQLRAKSKGREVLIALHLKTRNPAETKQRTAEQEQLRERGKRFRGSAGGRARWGFQGSIKGQQVGLGRKAKADSNTACSRASCFDGLCSWHRESGSEDLQAQQSISISHESSQLVQISLQQPP